MIKTLVLGSTGQLGQAIQGLPVDYVKEIQFYFINRQDGNICDHKNLRSLIDNIRPEYVINCAAYTAVDLAEDQVDLCRAINRDGPSYLAQLCSEFKSVLIHVSTDFVFSGNTFLPLSELSATNPVNTYGLTKLEGEREIQKNLTDYYIVRTSWLYSEYGVNFLKTMLKLGSERKGINVIADQFGTPTYAVDLAKVLIQIIHQNSGAYGVYHYSNLGVTTWFDFAKAIFMIQGQYPEIVPIPSTAYSAKARRPAFSILDKTKVVKRFGLEIPYWRDSLTSCLQRLNKTK